MYGLYGKGTKQPRVARASRCDYVFISLLAPRMSSPQWVGCAFLVVWAPNSSAVLSTLHSLFFSHSDPFDYSKIKPLDTFGNAPLFAVLLSFFTFSLSKQTTIHITEVSLLKKKCRTVYHRVLNVRCLTANPIVSTTHGIVDTHGSIYRFYTTLFHSYRWGCLLNSSASVETRFLALNLCSLVIDHRQIPLSPCDNREQIWHSIPCKTIAVRWVEMGW